MKTEITQEGWTIIKGDLISEWVRENKKLDHDEHLIPLACLNIPVGGIVIDCGGNIGSHTIAYAQKVGPTGTVIAIEAGPLAFQCLTENMKKAQGQVVLVNAAVCDEHAGRALFHTTNMENLGASGVNEFATDPDAHEVRTVSIDGIVEAAELERVDFIKIDIEGWELKALKGARSTLKRFRPKLLIEFNMFRLAEQNATYKDLYDFLLAANYSWQICQPQSTGGDAQYDCLCWPNLVQATKDMPNG